MTTDNTADKTAATQQNVTEVLNSVAKNRTIIPIAFALVIILFFFSFVDFKCNGVKMASISGINLVTGTHVKMASGNLFDEDSFNPNRETKSDPSNKVEPNIWAILSFLVAIGGLAAFYKKIKNESLAGTAAGVIGFISLLILRSSIKNKVGEQGGGMVQIDIDFQFAYWVCLLSFLVAGGISYLRMKQEKSVKPDNLLVTPDTAKPDAPLQGNNTPGDKRP